MQTDGQVYFGPEDEIPKADKERYDEAVRVEREAALESLKERLSALEAKNVHG